MFNPRGPFRTSAPTITLGVWQLFGLAAGAMLVLMGTLLAGLHRHTAELVELRRTAAIERNLLGLSEDLVDAETGQRGYLLTLDEQYLHSYHHGVSNAQSRIDALSELMRDPTARRNLDRIAPIVSAKLEELARTVALAAQGRRDAAMQIVLEGSGRRLMEEFRALRADTLGIELRLHDERQARVNATMTEIAVTLLLGGMATILVLFLCTRRTARNLGVPIQALVQGMLAVADGTPDRQLPIARNDEIGEIAAAFNSMLERLGVAQRMADQARVNLEDSHAALLESEGAQRQAETALRASEAFLDRVGTVAGVGGWELDLETQAVLWSEQTYRIHEVEPGYVPNLEGELAFYAPEARPIIARAVHEAVDHGTAWDLELSLLTAKGNALWVRTVGSVEFKDGKAAKLVGALQDITTRKRAEGQLAETVVLLRTVLESSTEVAIIASDPHLRITMFNAGAEHLLGYSSEEIVGRQAYPLIHDADEVRAFAQSLSAQLGRPVAASEVFREPATLRRQRRWTYLCKDGRRVPVSLVVTAMHTEAGELLGYVGVAHDVTRQQDYEASLRQATHDAERANRAKTVFLANMSHEIRTPMNAVIGLTYLLGQTSLTAEQTAFLQQISVASKLLLSVLTDVLDISKIEAGELLVASATFNPRELLNGLGAVMASQAKAKGISLRLDLPEDLPGTLEGDATRLNQILTNLLSNAIKFTERGEVTLSVQRIGAEPNELALRFTVRDTGIGISPDAQARLFTPFVQADDSITRRFGGTGLGLSIVHNLAKLLGGTVALTSTPGVGSEFRVELAFARAPASVPAPVAPPIRPAHGAALSGVRVLVVDDSDINLQVTQRILEKSGAQVGLACHGLEALDALRAHPDAYDVVLMDVHMPILDGHEATRRIRVELELLELPIIALTAGALASERQRAAAVGMDDFLIKPFDAATLVSTVRRHARSVQLSNAAPALA